MTVLEQNIKNTKWLVQKIKKNQFYAQNLYAALCYHTFVKANAYDILCANHVTINSLAAAQLMIEFYPETIELDWIPTNVYKIAAGFVRPGYITSEVAQDLNQLGWKVIK